MSSSTSWCIKKPGTFGESKCLEAYRNETFPGLCPAVWDGFLCWPPTSPSSTAQLQCPRKSGNDVTKFAFRICQENGQWGQNPNRATFSKNGWTNYQPCFNNYTMDLMRRLTGSSNSTEELIAKTNIAVYTRYLEMVGLIISALSLILALIIFGRFRNLWNNRTRIHKNLFIAMTIQVLTRLVVYIDQYFEHILDFECYTLQRMEYTCESAYTILEYAKTSMFMWMFLEGLYLHNMITVAVFQEHLSLSFYYLVGWGAPVILTSIWTVITANEFYGVACWNGYNFSSTFMVLEGPRLVVIFLNLFFLLNIMRVLVTKLRESNSTEAQQVRKAVRAAIVLLPLLGITNSIPIIHSPIEKSPAEFAAWSYGTTFLSTFQGFFCSLIYCFLNGEVQVQVRRYIRAKRHRKSAGPRRKSLAPGASMINHININLQAVDDKITAGNYAYETHKQNPKLGKKPEGKVAKNSGRPGDATSNSINSGTKGNAADPFWENWDEAELSSHNNVIIELVEIPHNIMHQHQGRESSSGDGRSGKVLKSIGSTSGASVHPEKNSSSSGSNNKIASIAKNLTLEVSVNRSVCDEKDQSKNKYNENNRENAAHYNSDEIAFATSDEGHNETSR